jgi:hypothetical protein
MSRRVRATVCDVDRTRVDVRGGDGAVERGGDEGDRRTKWNHARDDDGLDARVRDVRDTDASTRDGCVDSRTGR